MKTIIYAEAADRFLARQTPQVRARIEAGIETYVLTGHGDVKALKARSGYRLRIGDYRAAFNENMVVVNIVLIGHRSNVYK